MNILKSGYLTWRPRNWSYNIKNFFHNFKYAYQRITKGYCDRDLRDLNSYYLHMIQATLKDFSKNPHSYALKFKSIEEWQSYLLEIAHHFENAEEDNENADEKNENKFIAPIMKNRALEFSNNDKWMRREKELYAWRKTELCIGMSKLTSIWYDLWD